MSEQENSAPNFDHRDIASAETIRRHEHIVDEGFLAKLRKGLRGGLGRLPFAEELCAAWFCAMDEATPTRVRGILLAALAYFVMPLDMIPDFITGFGFTDDAAVIATAIGIVSSYITADHHARAKAFLLKEAASSARKTSK